MLYDYIIKISKCRVSCKFDVSLDYDWIQITRPYVIYLCNAILQIQVIEIASLYSIINGQYFKNRNVIKNLLNKFYLMRVFLQYSIKIKLENIF